MQNLPPNPLPQLVFCLVHLVLKGRIKSLKILDKRCQVGVFPRVVNHCKQKLLRRAYPIGILQLGIIQIRRDNGCCNQFLNVLSGLELRPEQIGFSGYLDLDGTVIPKGLIFL